MFNVSDYIGSKFGMLTIIEGAGNSHNLGRLAKVLCDCGGTAVYPLTLIKIGKKHHCGCKKTGIKLYNHVLYRLWATMKSRCYNIKYPKYKYYGGSGVTVCDEWLNNPKSFINWALNNGWEKGLELDKDIKGNSKIYSPNTCLFVSKKRNRNYTRKTRRIMFDGTPFTISELADKFDLPRSLLITRFYGGMDIYTACYKKSNRDKSKNKAITREIINSQLNFFL